MPSTTCIRNAASIVAWDATNRRHAYLMGGDVAFTDDTLTYIGKHYDGTADVPYLTLSGSNAQKCTYVTYEDETSIAAKAAWVKAQGLGGIIIWTLSEGYDSSGATVQDQNPLVEAMKGVF